MTDTRFALGLAVAAGLSLVSCGGSSKKAADPGDPGARPHRPILEDTEEPDDGLQVEGLRGTLDPADAQPVLEREFPAIERCYADNVGKNRFVGGQVQLKFRVAVDGKVKRVQVERGDFGAWPIERCVLAIARGLTFPRPRGGEAELRFPIDFPGRGSVVTLDEERAAVELDPFLDLLVECEADGNSSKVQITAYVGPGGEVKSAGFASEDEEPFDDAWADCAHGKVLEWKLTDPKGPVWKVQGWYTP